MSRKLTVLLVEDNPGDALLLKEILSRSTLDIQLCTAQTLTEATDIGINESIQVALLDLGLPDSQGLETVVRFHGKFPDIPVIVLTGFEDDDFAVRAVEAGAQDYLTKGKVDTQTVTRALRYALGRQETEKKLADSKTKIHQYERMEAIGQLAGGVAHDFNNLLTVITSFAEFGIDELKDGDPLKKDLNQILKAAERGSSLTRQLLAFSKKQVMEPEIININSLLKDLEKMLHRLIGEDIELQSAYDENIGIVFADPSQMDQVFMNLVVNAKDAMPTGGRLIISTRNATIDSQFVTDHPYAREGQFIHIRVEDTGIGMPASVRTRIFEPFYTTKPKNKGTGLGLSTVYGIVKQSNGIIEVNSTEGRGTIFDIYLPQVSGEIADRESQPDFSQPIANATILLVEDDKAVRTITQRILISAGYDVIAAANGGEALLECERNGDKIHLILSDVVMPKMGGAELVKRIQQICPSVKVLYMSGYTDTDLASYGVLKPQAAFLAKPFKAKELLCKVNDVLLMPKQ
ncbi:MAG: response regulator [Deltaproteobacteria bacterium]|nr:response regulator [Deltaproteobacteria bacterium]MBN2672330.1 response regulator [Deltaproteobacteria bacterium]